MSVRRVGIIAAEVAEAYRGTFGPTDPALSDGAALPPAWEAVYFPFTAALADLRPDGTPARDGVLPEIDLPRRLYAGEDTQFLHPIAVGERVEQVTTLGDVTDKTGSSGRLVFVDMVREYRVAGRLAIRSEWHDVFLSASRPDAPVREPRRDHGAAAAADWVDELTLDARQLFRFSAVTFNTHLIHYDRSWAQQVERLPDLLVHGPLTRILLMDAARRHVGRSPTSLALRTVAPVLVDRRLRLAGATTGDRTRVTVLDEADVVLAIAEIVWGEAS